jgi:aspartyl-tRNA(Asn)/glutamyl-tRNA(Gln) amidotransferase subunit C
VLPGGAPGRRAKHRCFPSPRRTPVACYDRCVSEHFTLTDIDRVAHLATLALSDDERTLFARQLGDILTYVEQLRSLDTSGIPPTSHPLGRLGSMRDDEQRPSLPRDQVLTQAPEPAADAGLFKVPRVLGS